MFFFQVKVSKIFDYIFTIIFLLECFLKAFALGFVLNKGSYLRDYWSDLDFLIVIISLIDIIASDTDLTFFKILRLLRILRPLRFISHNLNMKILVNALINSIGAFFNGLITFILIIYKF